MSKIIIREGEYIGFHKDHGYVYRLNGSFYGYKNGITKLIK